MPWVIAPTCKLELPNRCLFPHTQTAGAVGKPCLFEKWKIIKPTLNWYKAALPIPPPLAAASARELLIPWQDKPGCKLAQRLPVRQARLRGDKKGTPAPMERCHQAGTCRKSSLEVHREEAGAGGLQHSYKTLSSPSQSPGSKGAQWLLRHNQPTPSEQLGSSNLSFRQTDTSAFLRHCSGFSSMFATPRQHVAAMQDCNTLRDRSLKAHGAYSHWFSSKTTVWISANSGV